MEIAQEPQKSSHTCRTCAHRQRWECGGRVIQYCRVRRNGRTFNGLLRIKVTTQACNLYKAMEDDYEK
jgi:hypothetical protein